MIFTLSLAAYYNLYIKKYKLIPKMVKLTGKLSADLQNINLHDYDIMKIIKYPKIQEFVTSIDCISNANTILANIIDHESKEIDFNLIPQTVWVPTSIHYAITGVLDGLLISKTYSTLTKLV